MAPIDATVPARSAGFPLLAILAAFPIACFTCALAADIAFMQTTNVAWRDGSAWLLAVGMAGGVLAGLVGLLMMLVNRRVRRQRPVWPIVVLSLITLAVGFLDNLVHSRDGWTSVVPLGLTLSAITVVIMLVTAWLGFARAGRPATTFSGVRA